MPTRVMVTLPDETPYAVRIGADILTTLGSDLKDVPALSTRRDVVVVSDSNVEPLYGATAKDSLKDAGYTVHDITIPAGEESKSVEIASEIWSALASLGYGRDCFLVALGGGVVGDLTGFIAATYMRGVPYVQAPTTLLAMVDSSVGGKCAINIPQGKNLVGAFHQPVFVCADTNTLDTLPQREWLCGCAEIAKSAIIDGDDFFFWLTEHSAELAKRNSAVTAEAVERCVVFKAGVVAADKTESSGIRECLNFGHTLGHAIETVAGYGVFSHGAAVAEGMRFALEIARERCGAQEDFTAEALSLFDSLGLEASTWRAPAEDLIEVMKHDKKNLKGNIRFVLVDDVGSWTIQTLEESQLKEALERW